MKKLANIILLFFITTSLYSQTFQKDFKDYVILKLPQDRQMIGLKYIYNSFTGLPVKDEYLTVSNSLEKYFNKDTANFKFEILDVLNSTFNFDKNKFEITDLKDLEITDCNDYGMLPILKGNSIVVSSVRVKSLEITSKKKIDGEVKVDLGNYISNSLLKFDPKVTYYNEKASIKMGKDLVVAVKVIKISKVWPGYQFKSETADKLENNTSEFYDRDFKSKFQVAFLNCDDLSPYFTSEQNIIRHQGCFNVAFTIPSGTTGVDQMIGGNQLICPNRDNIKGEINLNTTYRPISKYTPSLIRPLVVLVAGNSIYRYTFQTTSIGSITYEDSPVKDETGSNFRIGAVDIKWEVKKYVYDFTIVRK